MFATVAMSLAATTVLLTLAHKLSVAAHGDSRNAPQAVLWARRLTWLLLGILWVSAMVLPDALHGHCFRTCAPFPN